MFSGLSVEQLETRTFHYISEEKYRMFYASMGLDANEIDEFINLFPDPSLNDSLESYISNIFEPKVSPILQTRFSDGSISVFYSALEPETAREEVLHHRAKQTAISALSKLTIRYMRLSCNFSGQHVNLRPHLSTFPFLIQNGSKSSAYEQCNRVGAEAVRIGLDGILTSSARRTGGTCLPVFSESALSELRDEGVEIYEYDPATSKFSRV